MSVDRDEVRDEGGTTAAPEGKGEAAGAAEGAGTARAAGAAQGVQAADVTEAAGAAATAGAGEAPEGAETGEAAGPGEPVEEPAETAVEELAAERDRLADENGRLRHERDQLAAALQQLRDAHVRLQADFDNFRRRTREEEARRRLEATEQVLRDVLPVVDNMERALQAARGDGSTPPEGALEGIRSGVELILQQLRGVLEKHGVTPAPGVGEPFDPRWHHAVAQETAEERSGAEGGAGESSSAEDAPLVVVEEFQKGYILGGRAIRPSLVKVGAAVPRNAGGESGKGNTL